MIDPFFDKDAPNCKECGVQMERGFDNSDGYRVFICANQKCESVKRWNKVLSNRTYPLDKADQDAILRGEKVEDDDDE
jgi:hypothetical protein